MKTIIIIISFFLAFQLGAAKNVKLTVKITNIETVKGYIEIGFYNDADKFPDDDGQYLKKIVKVTARTMTITVSLPGGVWAIAAYHDENKDGVCNRNFFGIPKERYGFSNNVKPLLSAPSFDKTKFKLYKAKTITIDLID